MTRRPLAIFLMITIALDAGCASSNSTSSTAQPAPSSSPSTPTVTVTTVLSQELSRQLRLPGELQPYQDVMLYPKVQGFIEWIGVDRGSAVRAGQPLVRLSAPEIGSQLSEAEAKTRSMQEQKIEAEARANGIKAQHLEAEAKLAAGSATYSPARK